MEELFIATAPGAPADVYFRNDQQVTPLNLRAQLPAWALADGADLMYVRWGTRSDSFFVKTAKFVPGDFVTGSAPDIMNEAYHVFTFARPALDVPLGGTPPAPTVVSSVRLDDAQIPTGVTIDYDFRTSNGGETQHLAGQLSPMFDATVWRGSGVNWGRALRVADVQLDDNLALQALLAIHEWDLFRAAAQQQGNTLLADSGPPLAGGDQLFLVDLSQQRVVWKSARDVISYRSELTITDVDDGQNQSITWVETESFTTYTDAVLQALGVPIDTTQWQTPKQTVETGPHFSDVRTFATSTLSLRLGGVYRPRRALAPGDTTLGSVVLTAVVNYDYVGSPFVVQVDGDSVVQSGNPARAAVRVVLYDVASDAPRLTLLSDGSHDRYAPSAQDTAIHFEDLGYPHTTFTQAVRYPDVTVLADGGDYVGLLYRQGQDDAGDFESQTGIPSPDDDRVLPPGRLFVVLASTGLNASTLAFQQTELVTDNGGYTDPPQGTAVLAFPLAALRPNFLYHGAATEQYFVNPLDAGGQLALTLDGVSARESTALSRDKAALLAVPAGLTVRTAAPDPVNDDEYQFGPSQHVINNSTLVGSSFVDDI
ncbi:MAG: hypothetical protein HYR86_15250 [Candidatus Rokubacteria bacterium]|nr:hypothetical protein [Candidatus Rokubacteria bacterium]